MNNIIKCVIIGSIFLITLTPITFVDAEDIQINDHNAGVSKRATQKVNTGGYVIDRIDVFAPGDINILEGIGLLFGVSQGDVNSIISLVKLGLGVVDFIDKVFGKIFNGSSIDIDLTLPGNKDRDMLAMFEVLTYRLEQMHLGIQGIESSLREMVQGLPHLIRWEVMLDSLEDYTKPINSLHQRFALYQIHREKVENHTLRNFAESVISHETDSIMNLMASVHSMVAPDAPPLPTVLQQAQLRKKGPGYRMINLDVDQHYSVKYKQSLLHHKGENLERQDAQIGELSLRPSVFLVLEGVLKNYDHCSMRQTPQQMTMGLYSLVALTQARGFAMINFAYMLLRVYGEGNFTVEQELTKTLYEYYSSSTMKQAMEVVKRSSNLYWRCDPLKHEQGETYVMFTELLQAHIENEGDMNDRNSCLKKCGDYPHGRSYGCYLPDQQICGKRKVCKGTLHNCRFIDADADVCYSSSPYRRYDWIQYENGRTLGERTHCNDLQKVDSWWRWFVHCSYCVCLCDDPVSPSTDRYVSLLPTETNLDDSMILTGIKITKHHRVVMLEVQQGRTMPQGQVDPSSLEWISLPNIDVDNPFFRSGTDYHILSYEARNLDLDNLKAPIGHVITGTRFRMLGTHLNLEVRVTPVSFQTGLLNPGLSYWISKDSTPLSKDSPRTELVLSRPNDPAKVTTSNDVDSTDNMYIVFQPTDFDSDVSQLTVPYFDALPVTTAPASWITGLNLHHKGSRSSGGFISFRIECNNATRHFEPMDEIASPSIV